MRTVIRHVLAAFIFCFACKVALQAQASEDNSSVPKSLLLSSMSTAQPLPTGKIDTRRIVSAIRKE
jgi:hypothetical protein